MKKNKLNERELYQGNTDEMREATMEMSVIAGRNLCLLRQHCKLSQREVGNQTGISNSTISNYEKEIKNLRTYSFLIVFYRDICNHFGIGEPDGIIQISSKLFEAIF